MSEESTDDAKMLTHLILYQNLEGLVTIRHPSPSRHIFN